MTEHCLDKKAMKFIDETTDKAKETRRISREGKQVAIEQRNWLVERSKLEAKINELRERSQDSSLTETERLKSLKEGSALSAKCMKKNKS